MKLFLAVTNYLIIQYSQKKKDVREVDKTKLIIGRVIWVVFLLLFTVRPK